MPEPTPVLYSFRRCPYAIRARLALAAAGLRPGLDLELREVSLKAKPPELLAASAKGTVPVLLGPGADAAPAWLLDESLAIMHWALERADPLGWLAGWSAAEQVSMAELLGENDGPFKYHLDRFRYAGELEHRQDALAILRAWDRRLAAGGWLMGMRPALADWALLPFVRQFHLADPAAFDAEPGLQALRTWLGRFLAGPELAAVMDSPWGERSPWRSPCWLYHLALRSDWQQARAEGVYRRSTRGRSLDEVGFIHLSAAHQVTATAQRFYGDLPAGELVLLVVDPGHLDKGADALRWEPAAPAGAAGEAELFPHLHGPLPLAAVRLVEPWQP